MNKAAFWDLDGTIVKGISGLRFTRFLIRRRVLPFKKSIILPAFRTAYDILRGKREEGIDEVDDLLAKWMKGLDKKKIEEQAMQYARLELNKVYKKSEKLIKWHKKKEHKLILLSVSPDELIEEIGKLLGFHECFGTNLEVKKGVYTGKINKPSLISKNRVKIIKLMEEKYDLDLSKSYAYGNDINDAPVLEAVGNPVAVNPNSYLKPIAVKNNWRII